MHKEKKKIHKLTQKQRDKMWGETGPYSQVNIIEQTRILKASITRVFYVVEAEINPFTYEFVYKHSKEFAHDEAVIQLLKYAEYRGDEFGYIVASGEVPVTAPDAREFAEGQRELTIQTVIQMHNFVTQRCGLEQEKIAHNELYNNSDIKFLWNPLSGRVEPAEDELWDDEIFIEDPSGMIQDSVRYYVVLAFKMPYRMNNKESNLFAKVMRKATDQMRLVVENIETFRSYMELTVTIPIDMAPDDVFKYIRTEVAQALGREIFEERYLITNSGYPTRKMLTDFLGHLPE